jgi:hypothetical protein
MKSSIFWDITPCNPSKINLHQETSMKLAINKVLPLACFLIGILFNPEDEGDVFLLNVR